MGKDPHSVRQRVEAMEQLLERSFHIPGTKIPFGLDSVVGLVPVLGDIVTKDTKLESLRAWAARMGIDMAQTVAVGDGANDLPMIHAAGLGVAFCAKPKVQEDAPHRLNERDLAKILDYLK